jgi:hypothetical protein
MLNKHQHQMSRKERQSFWFAFGKFFTVAAKYWLWSLPRYGGNGFFECAYGKFFSLYHTKNHTHSDPLDEYLRVWPKAF